jgi:hypothetical protein
MVASQLQLFDPCAVGFSGLKPVAAVKAIQTVVSQQERRSTAKHHSAI